MKDAVPLDAVGPDNRGEENAAVKAFDDEEEDALGDDRFDLRKLLFRKSLMRLV